MYKRNHKWRALLRWWPVALALLLSVGLLLYHNRQPMQQVALNKAAPSFTLPSLAEPDVTLRTYRGQVVFVNFWASWCKYCAGQAPGLQSFAVRYPTRVQILSVNYKEDKAAIAQFQQQYDITFPLLIDQSGAIADLYQVRALPTTWAIDEAGIVRREWLGPVTFEELQTLYQSVSVAAIDEERAMGPASDRYLFVTHGGLYLMDADRQWHSSDAGANWTLESNTLTESLPGRVTALAWSAQEALAWVANAGLYVSHGTPTKWELLQQSAFSVSHKLTLTAAPTGKQFWAGTHEGLYSSSDQGRTWQTLPVTKAINGLVLRPGTPDELLLATDLGLWRCDLDGTQVSLVPNSPVRRFDSVAVVQVEGKPMILVIAPNGDLYYTNGTGDWQLING